MAPKPYATPSDVSAEDGEVIVEGPDGVAVSFTPEAANETSERLLEASVTAKGQLFATRQRDGQENEASLIEQTPETAD